ncbi:YrhB domain-containing protein [Neorhizobium sp. NCHU2750]|uniref:YrhB domain-containing protein n=1 Tax=Neorhizobium sp. NCHU2750 TaxID=1825976 RepID=UPI000E713049
MLKFHNARRLAETWVQCVCGKGVELVQSSTIAKPYGWVFFYQATAYLQNPNDVSQALGGNAPFIIDRESGQITVLGTTLLIEEYLERFEATLPQARLHFKPEQPAWL